VKRIRFIVIPCRIVLTEHLAASAAATFPRIRSE
jgi:hypothetical protein